MKLIETRTWIDADGNPAPNKKSRKKTLMEFPVTITDDGWERIKKSMHHDIMEACFKKMGGWCIGLVSDPHDISDREFYIDRQSLYAFELGYRKTYKLVK